MKQTIDARGWQCPKPIIETKRMLDTMKEGSVTTIVDNPIAVDNLIQFSESLGYHVEQEPKEELTYVTVNKPFSEGESPIEGKGNLVIQISSNLYGNGTEELSESLMKAYIYALTEVSPKPATLMFINTGVFLTTEGSQVLDSLYSLEDDGVEILSCGACLNFYGLADSLKVGKVTNMYAMVENMHLAANAVKI